MCVNFRSLFEAFSRVSVARGRRLVLSVGPGGGLCRDTFRARGLGFISSPHGVHCVVRRWQPGSGSTA